MSSLGERLREERERLGLSQAAFAELADTFRQTVLSWERGKTAPDGFRLMKLAAAGVDVVYVMTGQREATLLSREETALVDNYRHSSPDSQRILRETSATFAQPVSGRRRKAG